MHSQKVINDSPSPISKMHILLENDLMDIGSSFVFVLDKLGGRIVSGMATAEKMGCPFGPIFVSVEEM